jgi:hypothetical protein
MCKLTLSNAANMKLMRFLASLSAEMQVADAVLDRILQHSELLQAADLSKLPKCMRTIRTRVLQVNGEPPTPVKSWMCPDEACAAINPPGTDNCSVCGAQLFSLQRNKKKKPLLVMSSISPLEHIKVQLKRKSFVEALARKPQEGTADVQNSVAWKEFMSLRKPDHHLMLLSLTADW